MATAQPGGSDALGLTPQIRSHTRANSKPRNAAGRLVVVLHRTMRPTRCPRASSRVGAFQVKRIRFKKIGVGHKDESRFHGAGTAKAERLPTRPAPGSSAGATAPGREPEGDD